MRTSRKVVVTVSAVAVAAVATVGGSAAQIPINAADLGTLGLPFGTTEVCAEFTDAIGLYEGNNVAMLGVSIGRVTKIVQQERHVEVRMSIPSDLDLPADVGATTVSGSIVTDRRVEFTKPYVGGPKLDTSKCISKTRTPKGISDVLDGINKTAEAVLGGDSDADIETGKQELATFVENIDNVIDGSGNQANLALAAISKIIGDPATKDAIARRLIDSTAELTNMFVTNWPDFQKVLDRLASVANLIQGATNGLGSAVAYANDFLPVIVRNIGKYDKQLYGLGDALIPFADELLKHVDDMGEFLAYLPVAIGKAPGLVDPIVHALLFTYKSPRFEVSAGGTTKLMNMADLLAASQGGQR